MSHLVIYGPPGSGKTTVGRLAAQRLGRDFLDGDEWIAERWGRPVASYFDEGEEALFRAREAEACRVWSTLEDGVIAPGGGALLNPHSRAFLEASGTIVCLDAPPEVLLARLERGQRRPLLDGDPAARLAGLLRERKQLYASFAARVDTAEATPGAAVEAAVALFQRQAGVTRFELSGGPAFVGRGLLAGLEDLTEARKLRPPFVVIADSNVAELYGDAVSRSLQADLIAFPAGEVHKTLDTARDLYARCLDAGMERGGTIVALGGGVAGDVAGFVAATLLRGVRWINLPTTLLAMVDASLGGKVGVDLPQGKNLVGAFHSPALVVADLDTLLTLPEVELRCGLAEAVKAAVIGAPELLDAFGALLGNGAGSQQPLRKVITRAAAVKVGLVNADPREAGERAKLNFGHTIGHGLEAASGYALRHGEAVAIGMAAETRLAERLGLAEAGLAERMAECLRGLRLPVRAAGLRPDLVRAAMRTDKKKAEAKLKFALPARLGEVAWGIDVDETILWEELREVTDDER